MPLRDDHDAALARADALQAELDAERARNGAKRIEELEKSLALTRAGLVAAVAVACLAIGVAVAISLRGDDTPRVSPPDPRLVADELLAQAQRRLAPELVLARLSVGNLQSNGSVDPANGYVVVESDEAAGSNVVGQQCTMLSWNARDGWARHEESCLPFTVPPQHPPGCTIANVLAWARRNGAPPTAAKLQVEWGPQRGGAVDNANAWMWSYTAESFARQYVEVEPTCTL